MGIENGVERYIPEIISLGLNDINRGQLNEIWGLYGVGTFMEPDLSQKEKSRSYLNSDLKRRIDYILGTIALNFGGKYLIKKGLEAVGKKNGNNGYFWLEVGFLGQETVLIRKIPTMREGAQDERGPFATTSIVGGRSDSKDERILGKAAEKIREKSYDEFPQFFSLCDGTMTAVGVRGYTTQENYATAVMESLVDSPEINFSFEVRDILKTYRRTMAFYQPKPAMVSLLSGYKSKDTDHWIRLMLDQGYLWNASPALDIKAFVRTINERFISSEKVGAR